MLPTFRICLRSKCNTSSHVIQLHVITVFLPLPVPRCRTGYKGDDEPLKDLANQKLLLLQHGLTKRRIASDQPATSPFQGQEVLHVSPGRS